MAVTCIIKSVLVTLHFLFRGPPVSPHIFEAPVENLQISKLTKLLRNEGTPEHEYVPRVHHLTPVPLQLFIEGEWMREVASDVLVHHGPVALANLIADGSAPVVSNEDEFFVTELLRQVGYVIGKYVKRVALHPLRLVRLSITPIVGGHAPDAG